MFEDREQEMISRIGAELRRGPALHPEMDERIMAAVRAEARAMRAPLPIRMTRNSWRWLREPRLVALSPIHIAAMAAGFALLAVGIGTVTANRRGDVDRAASASPATAPRVDPTRDTVVMQFVLVAPEAKSVSVVGNFNDWDTSAMPLARATSGGVWSISIPLTAGRHEYAFVVDGTRWVADPTAPRALGDDFGAPSSVVTVGEGGHST